VIISGGAHPFLLTLTWGSVTSVSDVELDNEGLRVYWHILRAEEAAVDKAPKITAAKYNDNAIIGARLLGFLLQDFYFLSRRCYVTATAARSQEYTISIHAKVTRSLKLAVSPQT
jgi:hypothetical protein